MMVCPQCRAEYQDGTTRCADCYAELVAAPPGSEPEPGPVPGGHDVDLVDVFETGNPSLVLVAKSLLDSAGIEFVTRGEALQDLFGMGRFPASMSLIAGPVIFQVDRKDAEDAATLLKDVASSPPRDNEDVQDDEAG